MAMKKLILSMALLAPATPTLAHEGHAAAQKLGLVHWLTETDHLVLIAVSLAVVLAFGVRRLRSRRG
jgi:hydrogenase/urease accessory protein HupE